MTALTERLAAIGWQAASDQLDEGGMAVLPGLLAPGECMAIAGAYGRDELYRSTIDMGRYHFGEGQYRYFDYPLPETIRLLRDGLYSPLAVIANGWHTRLGEDIVWPERHEGLIGRCAWAGQTRPTPLILRYGPGDYNCLHQDLYGEIHFPLQAVIMLSDPEKDFTGGEFVLVENRPRLQSRAYVTHLGQGDCAIFPVRDRPRASKAGWSRSQMRHGVSPIRSGTRLTLGIIFHDAA